ncbi:hypothetical protein H4S14_000829 [Agrobacterium vitis]|nr:hypothetical protein [Agrobacterium vitis]MBE1437102.1 hypothetical protein [Agrobacterium vitis]
MREDKDVWTVTFAGDFSQPNTASGNVTLKLPG